MDTQLFLWNLFTASIIASIVIGVLGAVFKPNIVKKIIALTIMSDSVCILIIAAGYVSPGKSSPPVHRLNQASTNVFVDPLPQALVVTAIVIGLALTILLSILALRLYEHLGTLDFHKALRVEEEAREVEVEEAGEE